MLTAPPNPPRQARPLKGVYAITDERLTPPDRFTAAVEAALIGGASIVQYRDKSTDQSKRRQQAATLVRLCREFGALSIINDDIELAVQAEADGVHVGREDAALTQARSQLGPDAVIGVSCYNQLSLAKTAIAEGANYVAFGRFFPSRTKPDAAQAQTSLITALKTTSSTPICAIGGITHANAPALIGAGSDMIAVVGDIFAADNIAAATQRLASLF